jgi:DNA-binding CsgD family transcriptional regulator
MNTRQQDQLPSSVVVPRPRGPLDDPGRTEQPAQDGSATAYEDLGDPFVGRADELALLGTVTSQVRRGRPMVVRVDGPAGIGKTALVEQFLQGESDLQVLRCAGEREESLVGFGMIDQLFTGAALSCARLLVGGGPGLPHFEPTTVGRHILTCLVEQEAKGPVVLVVDDLQWADPESLRALLFALRRVEAERVLTLLLTREGSSGPAEGLCRLASHRAGAVVHLPPLTPRDVRSLASALTARPIPAGLMARLHAHTLGNPSILRDVLAELGPNRWSSVLPALPVPRSVAQDVRHVLGMCRPEPRRLVQAAAVLGDGSRLSAVAALAAIVDPLATVECATAVGLLDVDDAGDGRRVRFPHPVVQAAVYEQLGPSRRVRLHRAAAELMDDDGARLRHRVAASDPPDEGLAAELAEFAHRQARRGAWTGAASALVEASRMTPAGPLRDRRLLYAVDVLSGLGDLGDADALAPDVARLVPRALSHAVLGHRALLEGRCLDAEALLAGAWERSDPVRDPSTAALVADRCAQHSYWRLRPRLAEEWARRTATLASPGDVPGMPTDALHDLATGQAAPVHRNAPHVLVGDDVPASIAELSHMLRDEDEGGWVGHRVLTCTWLARAEFLAGSWDASALSAARAVALVDETGHDWLRPLARWVSVAVPAARGEWEAAEEHAHRASASDGHYESMVVAGSLASAQVAAARGDHERVLRALMPVAEIAPREGVDEPGWWPWQALYGDALVGAGRLDEAEAFLGPHEESAAAHGRRLSVAALTRVRGRMESAAGRADAARSAFERGLAELSGLSVPFELALLELAFGQVLRRHGQRRAAVERLTAARDRFAGLGARPYVERCERELGASGPAPAKRHDVDPSRLTAQELAVARLVARGLSNRQVASELFVSVKTVQFHLTRIYAKLRVKSRVELAATYTSEVDS